MRLADHLRWVHLGLVRVAIEVLLLLRKVFLNVGPERGEERVETHLGLVTLNCVRVLTCSVLQRDEGLKQVAVLGCEASTVRVLLDFALTLKTHSTVAPERENLVIQ